MPTRLSATSLLVVCLAVWRATHLLWGEDGPGDVLVRFRKLAGEGFFGRLLDCFYCLSLWISLPFAWAMGSSWLERAVLWFSFSGGAILLERATTNHPVPAAQWHETPNNSPEEEHPDVLLR
jgi:hypothetical protein